MTTTDPVEAEARGQTHVVCPMGGVDWSIPLDVDTWPLTPVAHSVYVGPDGEVRTNPTAVVEALSGLLGQQWPRFEETVVPRRRDLAPASDTLAAAVGIPASPVTDELPDRAFGAIPRLVAVLTAWPRAVESDLDRFWGIDYRDRWRFTSSGQRKLTLRQIHARISHLPADSALAIAMGRRSPTELLLMDIYEPLAGRVHPARPLTAEQIAERRHKAEQMRQAREAYEARRVAQGHRNIDAALDAARANALRGHNG